MSNAPPYVDPGIELEIEEGSYLLPGSKVVLLSDSDHRTMSRPKVFLRDGSMVSGTIVIKMALIPLTPDPFVLYIEESVIDGVVEVSPSGYSSSRFTLAIQKSSVQGHLRADLWSSKRIEDTGRYRSFSVVNCGVFGNTWLKVYWSYLSNFGEDGYMSGVDFHGNCAITDRAGGAVARKLEQRRVYSASFDSLKELDRPAEIRFGRSVIVGKFDLKPFLR